MSELAGSATEYRQGGWLRLEGWNPGGEPSGSAFWGFQRSAVVDLQDRNGVLSEPGESSSLMMLHAATEFWFGLLQVRQTESPQHAGLRGRDVFPRTVHENDPVCVRELERQAGQERRYDLYGFSMGLREPSGVECESLDRLVFKVALGVIGVGQAEIVSENFHAAGGEHLHHHGCSAAWQAGDNGDDGGLSHDRAVLER